MTRVVVVGAGIAGLVAARRLLAAGLDVTVLEADPVAGGHARTVDHAGFRLEWGPHTLTGKAVTLLAEAAALGVEAGAPSGPGTRYLWRDDRLHALPTGPLGLLTSRALTGRGWLRLLAEPLVPARPDANESVGAFFARRLGPEAAHVLVGSFVSGIHAGDPLALSAAEAFPAAVGWERDRGSLLRGMLATPRVPGARKGLVAFRGGMGALTGALAGALGDRLRLGTAALAITPGFTVHTADATLPADVIVLATPPRAAARLLAGLDAAAADAVAGIPMAPLALVHFGGPDPHGRAPRGFGALVPRGEGVRTLGVLFVGSQLPDRLPDPASWLHAAFIGGATDPGALDRSDAELAAIAVQDSVRLTGFDGEVAFTRVIRHPGAIPQLVAGHRARVAAVRVPGLVLAGNWVRGVSAEDAAASGAAAAEAVLARVATGDAACA